MVGVIAAAALIGQTGIGHTLMGKAGLAAEPTGYTSLSFADPLSLPKSLDAKPQDVDLAFVISNYANSNQYYEWSVRLRETGSSQELASGKLSLAPAQTKTVDKSVLVRCSARQMNITVALAPSGRVYRHMGSMPER